MTIPVNTQSAAAAGRKDIIEKMVQFATDPNPSDKYGRTPMHAAARGLPSIYSSATSAGEFRYLHRQQHYAIIEPIIGKVPNKNPADLKGIAPLHCAAYNGDAQVFNLILKHAANKNPVRAANGRTPLHIAARKGHFKVCKAILENVEDQNPKDTDGRTPLHWAAENGHLEVCRLLLAAGNVEVARHQEDIDRYTPLNLARDNGHHAVAALFEEGRRSSVRVLCREVQRESSKVARSKDTCDK